MIKLILLSYHKILAVKVLKKWAQVCFQKNEWQAVAQNGVVGRHCLTSCVLNVLKYLLDNNNNPQSDLLAQALSSVANGTPFCLSFHY